MNSRPAATPDRDASPPPSPPPVLTIGAVDQRTPEQRAVDREVLAATGLAEPPALLVPEAVLTQELRVLVRRLDQVEDRTVRVDRTVEGVSQEVSAIDEALDEVQLATARLNEWIRLQESYTERERLGLQQGESKVAERVAVLEKKLAAVIALRDRLAAWTAGAAAGYVALRGADLRSLADKLLALLKSGWG